MLRQWKQRDAALGTAPSVSEKADLRQRLRAFHRRQTAEGKQIRRQRSKGIPLLPNVLCAKAADKSLLIGIGFGLQEFVSQRRPGPLRAGHERYLVTKDALLDHLCHPDLDFRSCVEDTSDGRRWLECVCTQSPRELHLVSDMGSVGLVANIWIPARQSLA